MAPVFYRFGLFVPCNGTSVLFLCGNEKGAAEEQPGSTKEIG